MTPASPGLSAAAHGVLSAEVHSVPKVGSLGPENEDSAAVNRAEGRVAIADGASTSARPEVWSRLLVEAFVDEGADPLAPETLAIMRDRWVSLVHAPDLPWYAQAKLEQGAASTFLGLHIDRVEGTFRGWSVGDSCLFHLRGHRVLLIGPVCDSVSFGNFPQLISSHPGAAVPQRVSFAGGCRSGDVFLLATDALAKLLIEIYERHGRLPPVETIAGDRKRFVQRIARYRGRGLLGNDDTTLCLVRL